MQWRVLITLAGADVSNRLTGEVMIDAEEDAAAIAEFTLLPEPGPIDADQWIGAAVLIDAVVDGGAPERLFTGTVDVPKYDIQSGLTRFRCTDGLQQYFDDMTKEDIGSNIVWAFDHGYVVDNTGTGWDFAQSQKQVYYESMDFDRFGELWWFDLTGPVEPAFFYDDSGVISDTVSVELPSRRDLINQIDLTVECRYTCYAEATAGVGWSWPYVPGDAPGWPVPSPSAAQSAAESVGHLKSFAYQEFPATGLFKIGSWTPASSVDISSGRFISWQNERPSETCFSFSGTAAKRAAVEVTWKARHRFRFDESIRRYGVSKKEEVFSLDLSAAPPSGWDRFEADPVLPPDQDRSPYILPDMPVSFSEDVYSDVLWALAYLHLSDVLKRHRARVHFSVPLEPSVDRQMFIRLDCRAVTASGKVYRYVHRLDTASGKAVTALTLAPNLCGAADWAGIDEWWEMYPEPLQVPAADFSASVTFESRDPSQSGSVGFQVDSDPPDFSPFEYEFSDPDSADGVRVGAFVAVADELLIHGRSDG